MAQTVLVPLDGSAGSEAVLGEVATLARTTRAVVRLLRVAPPPAVREADGRVVAYADQEATRVAEQVRDYLATAAEALPGLDVRFALRFGDPADEIVAEAREARADLIAMATHARQGLARLVHGSVAERVLHTTKVPVLLVAHGERAAPPAPPRHGRRARRRFWCAWAQRDVEVELVEQGLPWFRRATEVRRCTAFDPPGAITCHRLCLDATYRDPWTPPLPIGGPVP